MQKIISAVKKSVFFYIAIYLVLLMLSKIFINCFEYEFMSWVYYSSFIGIIIVILISTIRKIIKNKHNLFEKILMITMSCLFEILLSLFISFFIFLFLNITHDEVVTVGNEKYVKSTDFFEMHPHPKYYEYKNFLIRRNLKIETKVFIENT